jgi:predicted O-methyltransferase YrrM
MRSASIFAAVLPVPSLPRRRYEGRVKGIDGFFSEDEGKWYARFARELRGGTLVEIGSWKGRSTSFIAPICAANGTRLVCVDHYRGSTDDLAPRYAGELERVDVEAIFRANMAALGATVELLVETSRDAAERFPRASVDRVFLDGSHDAASVTEDLGLWFDRVRDGGVLAGHDYDPKHVELREAVDAFARERDLVVRHGPRSIYWLAARASPR